MNHHQVKLTHEDAANAAGAIDALAVSYRERARQCRDGQHPYESGPAWGAEADRLEALRDRIRAATRAAAHAATVPGGGRCLRSVVGGWQLHVNGEPAGPVFNRATDAWTHERDA